MSETLEAAPGEVISETSHATTYKGATAATLEGEKAASYALKVHGSGPNHIDWLNQRTTGFATDIAWCEGRPTQGPVIRG